MKILISEEEGSLRENISESLIKKNDSEVDLMNKSNDPKFQISTTHPVAVMK